MDKELTKMLDDYDNARLKTWLREEAEVLRKKIMDHPRPLIIKIEQNVRGNGWVELINLRTELTNKVSRKEAHKYLEQFRVSTFDSQSSRGSHVWVPGDSAMIRINLSDGPLRMCYLHQNPDPESNVEFLMF